jgi:hypothetical protein
MKGSLGHLKEKYNEKYLWPYMCHGIWRIKYNDELYKGPDVVRIIKVARIRWLGHLIRMEENSPCKKITSQPEDSWKNGKPKLR